MAIAFVNGAKNNATSNTTVSVTYSPTKGNLVLVFLETAASITAVTCKDNLNNLLIAGPVKLNTLDGVCFYYFAPAGATSFTCSWTTARISSIVVVEYSGVISVNPTLAGNSTSGNTANPFITVTLQDPNDWVVAGLGGANVVTLVTGNQREQVTTTVPLTVGDNTASTATAVSISGGMTSGVWTAILFELIVRPNNWDMDLDNQFTQPSSLPVGYSMLQLNEYSYGDYAEQPPLIPAMRHDSDAYQQLLQLPTFGQDDVLDAGVELVQPARAYDTDADNQISNPLYTIDMDLIDTSTEKISIPVNVWDSNEAENQKQQDPYSIDEDIIDTSVELIIVNTGAEREWDTDAEQQLSQAQINVQVNNFLYVEDDWTWATVGISVGAASDIILMSYYGYNILPGSKEDTQNWTQLVITVTPITDFTWDNDSENQLAMKDWTPLQDVSEPRGELIIILDRVFENDADHQFQQADYTIDRDLSDSFENLLQYTAGVPYKEPDTDAEQQFTQAPWYNDIVEDRNNFPIIPTMELDNDSDNQLRQLDWSVDTEIWDNRVELITTPVGWDTDGDQQLTQLYFQPDWDLSDYSVEKPIIIVTVTDFTWDIDLDPRQWPEYQYDRELSDTNTEKIFIPVMEIDNDSEQQFLQPEWYKDHLSDETVEKITLNPFVTVLTAYDTDAENQLQWQPLFGQDDVSDSSVELIQLNTGVNKSFDDIQDRIWSDWNRDEINEQNRFPIIPTMEIDNDAEQQFTGPEYITDRDTADTGVEFIQYSPGVIRGWDTESDLQYTDFSWQLDRDISETGTIRLIVPAIVDFTWDGNENQIVWSTQVMDGLLDEGVEKITLAFTITQSWDNDSDQQFSQLSYSLQDDVDSESNLIILPPFIDIVELLSEEEE